MYQIAQYQPHPRDIYTYLHTMTCYPKNVVSLKDAEDEVKAMLARTEEGYTQYRPGLLQSTTGDIWVVTSIRIRMYVVETFDTLKSYALAS